MEKGTPDPSKNMAYSLFTYVIPIGLPQHVMSNNGQYKFYSQGLTKQNQTQYQNKLIKVKHSHISGTKPRILAICCI